jgi:hypothetical protein
VPLRRLARRLVKGGRRCPERHIGPALHPDAPPEVVEVRHAENVPISRRRAVIRRGVWNGAAALLFAVLAVSLSTSGWVRVILGVGAAVEASFSFMMVGIARRL